MDSDQHETLMAGQVAIGDRSIPQHGILQQGHSTLNFGEIPDNLIPVDISPYALYWHRRQRLEREANKTSKVVSTHTKLSAFQGRECRYRLLQNKCADGLCAASAFACRRKTLAALVVQPGFPRSGSEASVVRLGREL